MRDKKKKREWGRGWRGERAEGHTGAEMTCGSGAHHSTVSVRLLFPLWRQRKRETIVQDWVQLERKKKGNGEEGAGDGAGGGSAGPLKPRREAEEKTADSRKQAR